jgi:hypothetical protein
MKATRVALGAATSLLFAACGNDTIEPASLNCSIPEEEIFAAASRNATRHGRILSASSGGTRS